jgi:disulfide bond formation protein DsbB
VAPAVRLYIAWLVAIVATLGSLYFSEVRHFVPCTLCWYQRILMYPLVLILGVGSYRMDRHAFAYALPLSVLGMFVSTFHYLEQMVPGFAAEALCTSGVPCSGRYIEWLGFITIPFLALIAFTIISGLLASIWLRGTEPTTP